MIPPTFMCVAENAPHPAVSIICMACSIAIGTHFFDRRHVGDHIPFGINLSIPGNCGLRTCQRTAWSIILSGKCDSSFPQYTAIYGFRFPLDSDTLASVISWIWLRLIAHLAVRVYSLAQSIVIWPGNRSSGHLRGQFAAAFISPV